MIWTVKKILLLWYTINENFGDVLIYNTIKDYLEKNNCICDYIDVGRPCIEIVQKANYYDFLLFAGGGIIERYVPNVIRYFKEDYEVLKVPYGIIGLSIGKFNYSEYSETIRFWIEKSEFFYTRDEYSAMILNKIGGSDKVKNGVDIVWANESIWKMTRKQSNEVGINVRDVPYVDIYPDIDWREIKKIVNENNISIQIPDESGQEIAGLAKYDYNINEVIKQISRCGIIVAMRYHVILVAAILGVPSIPIAYCNKVHELSLQLKLNEYEVDVAHVSNVNDYIKRMQNEYDSVKKKIADNSLLMRENAQVILKNVVEIING